MEQVCHIYLKFTKFNIFNQNRANLARTFFRWKTALLSNTRWDHTTIPVTKDQVLDTKRYG
jgi:hypothetical protein